MKVLPERFVFLDRRRIEDAVATLAHAHRAGLIETGLLEFPIQCIDILKDEQLSRFDSFPFEDRADALRQMIVGQMRFPKDDNQGSLRIVC